MGQRANYIIIENNRQTIYYSHWRANSIFSDLYLGEKRFIEFVRECEIKEELLDEVWMEGCVIIDIAERCLFFWSLEATGLSSVLNFYVSELGKIWHGWRVELMRNRMYDGERVLGINYISQQEISERLTLPMDAMDNDEIDEWGDELVIIKNSADLFITKTRNIEWVVALGERVIDVLLTKPGTGLVRECNEYPCECVVIDIESKHIYLSSCCFGRWEISSGKWTGYQFTMGGYGYIDTLELAGIDARHLAMTMEEIKIEFEDMTKAGDAFDPHEFASHLLNTGQDVQFNPSFFDNVKPQKTFWEILKDQLKKIFGH